MAATLHASSARQNHLVDGPLRVQEPAVVVEKKAHHPGLEEMPDEQHQGPPQKAYHGRQHRHKGRHGLDEELLHDVFREGGEVVCQGAVEDGAHAAREDDTLSHGASSTAERELKELFCIPGYPEQLLQLLATSDSYSFSLWGTARGMQ